MIFLYFLHYYPSPSFSRLIFFGCITVSVCLTICYCFSCYFIFSIPLRLTRPHFYVLTYFISLMTPSYCLLGFRSLVEEESTYWALVNLLNLQNELMDVHQSDISKMLLFSTSNLVSFRFIKSHHFTWAYLVLLHRTSHASCILFFFWFPHAGSRESTHYVSLRKDCLWHYDCILRAGWTFR